MAHPKGPRHSIELNLLHEASITSDSDAEEDCPSAFGSHEFSSGINLDAIKSAKKVDSAVAHQVETKRSILALVIDDGYLIAGLEGGDIVVWSLETFEQVLTVHAHADGVLSLFLSENKQLLFSSGVDSVVNVWSAENLAPLFSIYSHHDIGDIFCVVYSTKLNTLFCGSQNQSLQWFDLGSANLTPRSASFPASRVHRFFDSTGPGGILTARPTGTVVSPNGGGQVVTFKRTHYQAYAHSSYVYCMLLSQALHQDDADEEVLVTGGGDGSIRVWSLDSLDRTGLTAIHKFKDTSASVLTLAQSGIFLYAGLADGRVHVYNLDSRRLVQRIKVDTENVTTVQVVDGVAFCGTGNGLLTQFDSQFSEVKRWKASHGKMLASTQTRLHDREVLITGGNDRVATFWDVSESIDPLRVRLPYGNDELVNSLRDFVAFRSISGNPKYVRQCNEAATFLRKLFDISNAKTSLLSSDEGVNPALFAKFEASDRSQARKSVLFYGHYDVVDAEIISDNDEKLAVDPFQLRPVNGYLYGRGVTDNKGPICAALYAVADLVQTGTLNCDVIFLIEGDEEAGSRGFAQLVQENRQLFGKIDWILLSNSYWLDDHIPCLTYGMRGVIHASVTVSSGLPDRHSGMDGKSTLHEPLKDLTVLLGSIVGANGTNVRIPGFYEHVAPFDKAEKQRYDAITDALRPCHPEIKESRSFTESLAQRWREPNLTIHRIEVPKARAAVTIARFARADLSIRIVPNQDAAAIAAALIKFAHDLFSDLESTNDLEVHIASKADAWLGDPNNELFQILDQAIRDVWAPRPSLKSPRSDSLSSRTLRRTTATSSNLVPSIATKSPPSPNPSRHCAANGRASGLVAQPAPSAQEISSINPLYIREGGSIPAISFLQKEFNAPAAMFPCGQASDNAHLDNERMRVQNLYNGREIFKRVFEGLPRC